MLVGNMERGNSLVEYQIETMHRNYNLEYILPFVFKLLPLFPIS